MDLERIGQGIGKESSGATERERERELKKEYILQLVLPNCFPLAWICPKAHRRRPRLRHSELQRESEYKKKQGTDAVVTDEGAHVDFMGSKEPCCS